MANRVLIAGHSQVKYFDQYLNASNVDVLSFPGYHIEEMWDVIGHMVPNYKIVMLNMVPNYKIVMLHMGANNLWNDTPSQVLAHYQFLVQQIRRANLTCYMVISGLLPRGQDMFPGKMKSTDFISLVNRKAAYINTRLYNIVQSVYRVNYIGHPSFVIGGKLQRHLLSKDGLHLTRDGATMVVRDLEVEIRRLRRPTQTRPHSVNYVYLDTNPQQPPTPYMDALKSTPEAIQRCTRANQLNFQDSTDFPPLPSRSRV